jgi:hypothetical protein
VQGRGILTLAALATALVAVPAGSAERVLPAPRAALLVTTAPRIASAAAGGLYLVSAGGPVQKLLDTSWNPLAAASIDGPYAAFPSGPQTPKSLSLVTRSGAATELPSSAGARCVAFSADGRFLSFVAGAQTTYARTRRGGLAWGISGALYVSAARPSPVPVKVANGVFPTAECPRWSPSGAALAFVHSAKGAAPWSVSVWRESKMRVVGTIGDTVPSVQYPTFAWAGGTRLLFFDSTGLYATTGTPVRVLDAAKLARIDSRARDRYPFSLSVSPNGKVLGVSIGHQCGVFRIDGRSIAVVQGQLNGWAGNHGTLNLTSDRFARVTLYLHTFKKPKRSVAIARFFKAGIVTDPAGAWFGYVNRSKSRSIEFRRADATLIRRLRPSFNPYLIAGVARGGRIVLPVSVY